MKAVVIGAGIGGLATAIRLAREGYSVIVIEKNSSAGGRCGEIKKEGFRFDTGPTFYIFPTIYRKVFASFGENIDSHLSLQRIEPISKIYFSDNTDLVLTKDKKMMKDQLETFEKGSYSNYLRLLAKSKTHHKLTIEKILSQDASEFKKFFNFDNLDILVNGNILENHNQLLGKYFKSPKLRAAFSYHDSYVGLSPYSAPAMFSMFLYSELSDGVWYPKGGMYKIVEALLKIAKKNKVKIIYNSEINKINKLKDRVISIETKDKVYGADVFVSNADPAHTYHLIKHSEETNVLKRKHACSVITFYWGLTQKIPLLTHNIFLSSTIKKSYKDVTEKNLVSSNPHFYAHAPLANTLIVHVPTANTLNNKTIDWGEAKLAARKFVIKRLKSINLDIEKMIKTETIGAPTDFENRFNISYGSAIGLKHNVLQMGYFRVRRQDRIYKNLYFVGSNTHPGCGVPSVLLSSMFTSEKILSRR